MHELLPNNKNTHTHNPNNKYMTYSVLNNGPKFSERIVPTKICVCPKTIYKICNYDKGILSVLDSYHSIFRSVVYSYPENKLVSFSPPKSIEYKYFTEKYPKITDNIIASEHIEGLSISLFYDHRIQSWEISTKTNIGGNYWFFTQPYLPNKPYKNCSTFYDMFLDALRQPRNIPLNEISWLNELSTDYCYSFVLQHPENPIVIPITQPILYIVAIYKLENNTTTQIPLSEYYKWSVFKSILGIIDFPKYYDSENYKQLETIMAKEKSTCLCKGISIWNYETGERTTLKNANYEQMVKLITIPPLLHYQYLCAKYVNNVDVFLQYYSLLPNRHPKYKHAIAFLEKQYSDFIVVLHKCYMNVYIHKIYELSEITMQYRPYVEVLHKEWYLPYKGTNMPIKITKNIVRKYISSMEPRELLYIFSYLRRECLMTGLDNAEYSV